MRNWLAAILFLVFCPLLLAQQALNNDSVIKLVKAGLSDDLIIATINATPGTYDTSADGIIGLKSGGASDKVIGAILVKSSPKAAAITPEPSQAAPGSTPQTSAPAQPAKLRLLRRRQGLRSQEPLQARGPLLPARVS